MESLVTKDNGALEVPSQFTAQANPCLSSIHEGVALTLSKWSALQMALQNRWGGVDSFDRYQQLISDVVSWFSQPRASLDVEDLENLLHESMLLSFNTEIEDGSIEEVAEQLMTMHEESLQGSMKQKSTFYMRSFHM